MYEKSNQRRTSIQILLRTEDVADLLGYSVDHTRSLMFEGRIPFSRDQQQNLFVLLGWMLKRNNKELFDLLEAEHLLNQD